MKIDDFDKYRTGLTAPQSENTDKSKTEVVENKYFNRLEVSDDSLFPKEQFVRTDKYKKGKPYRVIIRGTIKNG